MGVIGDIYEGGGAKPVSWAEIGETIEGEIVQIRNKQLTKFGTQIPDTWDDGSAKYTPIITVQVEGGLDDDDDGRRDIYLRANAFTAFGKALREAYKVKPSDDNALIGARLKIQFFKTEKSGKGQPRKLFRARITPKSPTAATDSWDETVEESPAPASRSGAAPSKPTPTPPPAQARQVPEDDIPF